MAEDVTYEGGNKLQAGWISTDQVPVAADTYYDGMLLEYDAGNDRYMALATDANMAAIYNGVNAKVYATEGVADVIVAGEISEDGLVDNAGSALTLTEDNRAAYRDSGFYIKRT